MKKVEIRLDYAPRAWQRECHVRRKRFTVLALHRRAGKALDVDTPIPMATGGFKRMGDLVAGDTVFDEAGQPCNVVHAHDVMHGRKCLEMVFSDGTRIVCDEDHLWHTQTKLDRANRIGRVTMPDGRMSSGTLQRLPGTAKTAREIRDTLLYVGENNHSVPVCRPIQLPHAELPIPPYMLGLWLGDGHSSCAAITSMDHETHQYIHEYAASHGWKVTRSYGNTGLATTLHIVNKKGARDNMQSRLRALGCLGNKHIPDAYMWASERQRMDLFAGLMDTDGSISRCGRKCEITLVNRRLAEDTVQLARSLGLKTGMNDKVINGKVYHRITFSPRFNPFKLPKKAERYKPSPQHSFCNNRYILAVNEVKSRPVRCITVDSQSSLYLCSKAFVPTHNTTLAVMELIKKSTACQQPLGLYVYVAPFLKQAKAIAWSLLKHKLEPMRVVGAVDINESELSVKFKHNGATIRLFGGDNPDAMRGVRLDGVVIDEVAQIKPEVWNDIIQPALSDRRGWALFIGTPSGINLFSELYYKAAELPDWFQARYTVYDTDALAADEVERLRRDMAETSFAREYLCDFSAAGDDQLISLADVEEAARRVYTEKDVAGAPLVIGVDPARFGDDRSVVFRRRGLQAFTPWVYRGIDNMELAARVAAHINEHDPDAVFIDSGAGAGVIDRLRQLDYDVVEVPFGGRAVAETQFVNRRAEMWWAMKEWLEHGGAIPQDPALRQELATPVYWYDASGKRVLESKDEVKKRLQGGGSPDLADALALTFAHPVASRLDLPSYAKRKREHDYDPYSQAR